MLDRSTEILNIKGDLLGAVKTEIRDLESNEVLKGFNVSVKLMTIIYFVSKRFKNKKSLKDFEKFFDV